MRISSERQQTPSWSSYLTAVDPATLYLNERTVRQWGSQFSKVDTRRTAKVESRKDLE